MEIIGTLIGEFVISPILSFCVQVFQFVFWMGCWVIWGVVRSIVAVGRSICTLFGSKDADGST
jgi:hypothetical protein